MENSSISQTEDLRALLKVLEHEIPAYLRPLEANKADPPSLKHCPSSHSSATTQNVIEGNVESKEQIIHACEKIVALLQGPTVKLTLDASGHLTSAAISIAIKLRLPHLISSDANVPTTLDELAKATTASPDLLGG